MVLARTRQLAAHEVGHTLGLLHNFAASSVAQDISVMDYPHPWITLDANGRPDLSRAYAVGVGAWDVAAIQYGYTQFSAGADEHAALDHLLREDQAAGLRYLTDEDARPLGSASPYAHLWDNGPDAPAELKRILEIRKAALVRFGQDAIRPGTPLAQLEDTLVPLYLLHRYQTEAAAKWIGGLDYSYAMRADGGMITELLPPDKQRNALAAVLETLSPDALTLPESLLKIFPPRPPDYPRTRESFAGHTGLTFDAEGPVQAAAELTASLLFDSSRASRLVEDHAREPQQPGLEEVLDRVLTATWRAPRRKGLEAETQFTVDDVILNHLLQLAAIGGGSSQSPGAAFPAGVSINVARTGEASGQARAVALAALDKLEKWLKVSPPAAESPDSAAHRAAAISEIEQFRKAPSTFVPPRGVAVPPGQPIGEFDHQP